MFLTVFVYFNTRPSLSDHLTGRPSPSVSNHRVADRFPSVRLSIPEGSMFLLFITIYSDLSPPSPPCPSFPISFSALVFLLIVISSPSLSDFWCLPLRRRKSLSPSVFFFSNVPCKAMNQQNGNSWLLTNNKPTVPGYSSLLPLFRQSSISPFQMKLPLLFSLAAVALAAPRQKRLTVGTIAVSTSGAGGGAGCVVTGNVLYVNGFKQRELTSSEQEEFSEYQKKAEEYKAALKNAVAEKQKALEDRIAGKKNVGSTAATKALDLPKAPSKPSFCSAEDTTQYIFDGCMVQNNKVYVGREYARDLTAEEIEELKVFDTKQSAYQKYVQEQVSKQVKGLFGSNDLFSALFNDGPAEQTVSTTRASTAVESATPPEAPKVPNFCTVIF